MHTLVFPIYQRSYNRLHWRLHWRHADAGESIVAVSVIVWNSSGGISKSADFLQKPENGLTKKSKFVIFPKMKNCVFVRGKGYPFTTMAEVVIQVGDELWICDRKNRNNRVLRFIKAMPGWRDVVGKWREYRKRCFGSQATAATALGVTQSFLSKVENGKRQITARTLVNWLQMADVWKELQKMKKTPLTGVLKELVDSFPVPEDE